MYQRVHKRLYIFKEPHKVVYQVSEFITVVGWATSTFELFAAFSPMELKSDGLTGCNAILKWLKEIEPEIFVMNYVKMHQEEELTVEVR
jgi:hypothetical protein